MKGQGQLAVRLKDADIIVLVRERTQITRQLAGETTTAEADCTNRQDLVAISM